MAPIHDTDVAEERWNQATWNQYELWEKVEHRARRKKRLWIAGTIGVFLLLSAVPILRDRWPKWASLGAARRLAREVNLMKREASVAHAAFRIRFNGALEFQIEKSASCSEGGAVVRKGSLREGDRGYALIAPAAGEELGVPGLIESFCYDYLSGSEPVLKGRPLVGFGIIPVNDLAEKRTDRVSMLLLGGPSAEPSFD